MWRPALVQVSGRVFGRITDMPGALVDLLFWIAVFVALFFLIRHLQKRKNDKD